MPHCAPSLRYSAGVGHGPARPRWQALDNALNMLRGRLKRSSYIPIAPQPVNFSGTVLSNPFIRIRFVLSANKLAQLPPDTGAEVAFVGRSNAGKSSAINAITARKGLARTSKTPGRTGAINVFAIDERCRLLDLPGFGYARVPESVRRRWTRLVSRYLQTRRSLAGLVLLIDVRRSAGAQEKALLEWCRDNAIPTHVLLAKSDKLGRGSNAEVLRRLQTELLAFGPRASAQLFSAHTRDGLAQARGVLMEWLRLTPGEQKKAPANKGREPGA